LDADEGSVELIKADEDRLLTPTDEPRRHAESHDAGFLHSVKVRITTNITLTHRGETDVEEGETQLIGDCLGHERLTDTGRSAHEDCHLRWELSGDVLKSLNVHVIIFLD
jgi:hypothetical protein